MTEFTRRSLSVTLTAIWGVALAASCGRTAHDTADEPQKPTPSESAGEPSSTPPSVAGGGANQGGSSATGTSGSEASVAGAPVTIDPSDLTRPCRLDEVPGKACEDPHCFGERCGVSFALTCREGTWDIGESTLAWELACPVSEFVDDIGLIDLGACCSEILPRNDVYIEPPSCTLCPSMAPEDGEPCSLPDDCSPPIIDCFYKCCCYGNTTWAQCDGKEWHVATNCSAK